MLAQNKLTIVHFHNGTGGGVLSVIRNLLRYKQHRFIENHVIYTINKEHTGHFELPCLAGADSEQLFYFSAKWNFYYTCKQLAKLVPAEGALLVAHDWLELGMVSNLGLQNPVVQFVHGNYAYYLELAKKNECAIDKYISISRPIYQNLQHFIPTRINDMTLLFFPVPEVPNNIKPVNTLNVYFGVRDLEEPGKNFTLLGKIDEYLVKSNVQVNWYIIGSFSRPGFQADVLDGLQHCLHFSFLKNSELINLLSSMHVFLLPSIYEGLPVSLIEAMKAGLVPIITDWQSATKNLVVAGVSGYYESPDNAKGYSEKIMLLNKDRVLLKEMAKEAKQKSDFFFDPIENTRKIEEEFIKVANSLIPYKRPKKVYGSRLDNTWIPNRITRFIRSFA